MVPGGPAVVVMLVMVACVILTAATQVPRNAASNSGSNDPTLRSPGNVPVTDPLPNRPIGDCKSLRISPGLMVVRTSSRPVPAFGRKRNAPVFVGATLNVVSAL